MLMGGDFTRRSFRIIPDTFHLRDDSQGEVNVRAIIIASSTGVLVSRELSCVSAAVSMTSVWLRRRYAERRVVGHGCNEVFAVDHDNDEFPEVDLRRRAPIVRCSSKPRSRPAREN